MRKSAAKAQTIEGLIRKQLSDEKEDWLLYAFFFSLPPNLFVFLIFIRLLQVISFFLSTLFFLNFRFFEIAVRSGFFFAWNFASPKLHQMLNALYLQSFYSIVALCLLEH